MWPPRGGDIAIAHPFRPPPYGGSNQFLLALRSELRRRGHRVSTNRIGSRTRACLLNAFLFDDRFVERADREHVRIVHRVDGPVSVYRGVDDGTDERVAELNARFADTTVFQSQYSMNAMRARGMTPVNPTVVHNAVDPAIFHRGPRTSSPRIRLISTSWSNNPNKGFDVYEHLDRTLDFDRFDYTFVGRAPVVFRNINMIPPSPSEDVAELLRAHDIFVFASQHESCSNALLEALACGLPALYVESGSNGELVREGGVGFASLDDVGAGLDRIVDELDDRRDRIVVPSLADVTDRYLAAMGLPAGD